MMGCKNNVLSGNSNFQLDRGTQYSQNRTKTLRSRLYRKEANVHNRFKMAATNLSTLEPRRTMVRLQFSHNE